MSKKISELDGFWSIAFCTSIVSILMFIPSSAIWMVTSITAIEKHQAVDELRISMLEVSMNNHLGEIKDIVERIENKLTDHLIGHK